MESAECQVSRRAVHSTLATRYFPKKEQAARVEPGRPAKKTGNVLLSRGLHHSTIAAEGLNGRVRNGNGCGPCALVVSRLLRLKAVGNRLG